MPPSKSPAAISPPRRRPVSHMKSIIDAHAPGDEWTVQFRSPIFGVYSICGPVHRSEIIGEIRIGLALITSGGRTPGTRVLNIWPERAGLIDVGENDCDPASVQHGALVSARISSFGDELTVVGHAVAQRRTDLVGVGNHTIRAPYGVAPNLLSLSEVHGTSFNCPPVLYAWSDADARTSSHR